MEDEPALIIGTLAGRATEATATSDVVFLFRGDTGWVVHTVGRLEDLAPAFSAGPASALPSASRSVIYADDPAAAVAAIPSMLPAEAEPLVEVQREC